MSQIALTAARLPRVSVRTYQRPARQALKVVMFKTDKMQRMLEMGRLYAKTWQPELASNKTQLKEALSSVASPAGILYKADGVIHPHDRMKSVDDITSHIQDRYTAYKHVVHDVFAMAADEASRSVYLGMRYILQNVGPVAGKSDATGKQSEGVLLERLELDDDNKITTSLVCRTLTQEERESLTSDPSAVHPGSLDDKLLYAPSATLSAMDTQTLREMTEAWVHCWDSGSPFLGQLEQIVSPQVQQVSGYGLSKRSVPFTGIDGARQAINSAMSHLQNTNQVLHMAICDDRRAGFVCWEADSLPGGSRTPQVIRGFDYLRFDDNNRISYIYNFTMRPYANVVDDEKARSDKVD